MFSGEPFGCGLLLLLGGHWGVEWLHLAFLDVVFIPMDSLKDGPLLHKTVPSISTSRDIAFSGLLELFL